MYDPIKEGDFDPQVAQYVLQNDILQSEPVTGSLTDTMFHEARMKQTRELNIQKWVQEQLND